MGTLSVKTQHLTLTPGNELDCQTETKSRRGEIVRQVIVVQSVAVAWHVTYGTV